MNFARKEQVRGDLRGIPAPMDGALDAIRRTMDYVAANATNREAFARAPAEVLRAASVGIKPEDVQRAAAALEQVLRIARFDWATNAQALLGITASVVRARS